MMYVPASSGQQALEISRQAMEYLRGGPSNGNITQFLFRCEPIYGGGEHRIHIPDSDADAAVNGCAEYAILRSAMLTSPWRPPGVTIPAAALKISDIVTARNSVIEAIFSGNGLPQNGVDVVYTDVSSPLPVNSSNLYRVDRLDIIMKDYSNNIKDTNKPFVFVPSTSNGKLVIYSGGHTTNSVAFVGPSTQTYLLNDLIDSGYTVCAHYMAFGVDTGFAVSRHNSCPAPTASLNYLKFFIEPFIRVVNQYGADFDAVYTTGISGGGCVTVIWQAVDTRVVKGCPTAGSWPLYINADREGLSNGRDFEQHLPGISSIVDYPDLYVMACSDGRVLYHMNGDNDNSCFYKSVADKFPPWDDIVSNAAPGYTFEWFENNSHSYSPAQRLAILSTFNAD